jgi:uncharacterized membrane-anchored protein YhcB (DUF1043 family)
MNEFLGAYWPVIVVGLLVGLIVGFLIFRPRPSVRPGQQDGDEE